MSADPNAPALGEIDLETGRSNLPGQTEETSVETAATEEAAEVTDETVEEVTEPVTEPAVATAEKPKHKGAVAELIARREETRLLRERLQSLENDPAIQRLTPEIKQAIAEGRIVVAPKPTPADTQTQALAKTAERLGLLKADGTPDLEAASRVDGYVREVAHAAAAPAQQAILTQQADRNVAEAVRFATESGYGADTIAVIRQTFENAKNAPNGAAMVANGEIAKELWFSALGKAEASGKLVKQPKKAAVTTGAPVTAPIVAEPTGKRTTAAVVNLTPKVQALYKSHGIDPAKSWTAQRGSVDLSQGYSLEE